MRRYSMSYLTAPMPTLVESVRVAASTGYDHLGLRLNATVPGDRIAPLDTVALAEARRLLADTGLTVIEIEGWMLRRGLDLPATRPAMEAAAHLGTPRLIAVGDLPDRIGIAELADAFAALAELAAEFGLQVDFEPVAHRAAGTLHGALAVVGAAAGRGAGLILDMLHIHRMGATLAQLASVDPAMIHAIHVCDAPTAPNDLATMIQHSAFDRDLPGDGVLPIASYLAALPAGRPLCVEIPMQRLASTIPPEERARRCLAASRRFMDALDCRDSEAGSP
jgi:sugar phosphate isomerase/epimerase